MESEALFIVKKSAIMITEGSYLPFNLNYQLQILFCTKD